MLHFRVLNLHCKLSIMKAVILVVVLILIQVSANGKFRPRKWGFSICMRFIRKSVCAKIYTMMLSVVGPYNSFANILQKPILKFT